MIAVNDQFVRTIISFFGTINCRIIIIFNQIITFWNQNIFSIVVKSGKNDRKYRYILDI